MKTILFTALVLAAGCSKKSPAKQNDEAAGSGSATETKVAAAEPATTTEPPAKADPTPSGPAGAALPGAVIDPALAKQPLALSLAGKPYTFKGGIAFGGSSGSMTLWLYPEVVTDCEKGKDFAAKKGLALMGHDDNDPNLVYVNQILFFADPAVTCATVPKPDAIGIGLNALTLNSKHMSLGTTQPVYGATR